MRIFLQTFGCRANHYDTEMVRAMVEGAGHTVVASAADADVAVFNSCAVTAEAVRDLRKSVRRAARLRPELRSVVMGCAPGLPRDDAAGTGLAGLPNVAALVRGADLAALAEVLELPPDAAAATAPSQGSTRALLRIQDGCDEHCTFCATRLARGANRSRPVAALVDEAARLAAHHPEIVLTGIHIGSYGADTGESLGRLLETLVRRVPTVRFRLSSLEATEVDDRLLDLLTGAPGRVCPYLHAPLQSGSDRLLHRMGRHWYTAASYADAVERLVARSPVFGLGADVITGFPGETPEDHARTLALVERLPFTYLHVFPFSLRPGTPAEHLDGQLAADVSHARAAELRALAARKAEAYRARRTGGALDPRADVVVIGGPGTAAAPTPGAGNAREAHAKGEREGLTEDYLSVSLPAPQLPRGARLTAELVLRDGGLVALPI